LVSSFFSSVCAAGACVSADVLSLLPQAAKEATIIADASRMLSNFFAFIEFVSPF